MLVNELDMSFNYAPIKYREIKSGSGRPIGKDSQRYQALCEALPTDKAISDIYLRKGERLRCFTDKIVWDDEVLITLTAQCTVMRGEEKEYISNQDVISASTFPQDYNFGTMDCKYVCGMSVPPPL